MELTHKDKPLKELTEYFLRQIFEKYKQSKRNSNFSMGNIAKSIGMNEFDNRIIQVTELLQSKGYIECLTPLSSGMWIVKLTPDAILYLEATNDTTIKDISLMDKQTIMNFYDKVDRTQINTNSSNVTQYNIDNNSSKIFEKLIEVIKHTDEINNRERKDLLTDIEIIKQEITKSKPDKSWISDKLNLMKRYAFLAQYIPPIIEFIRNTL